MNDEENIDSPWIRYYGPTPDKCSRCGVRFWQNADGKDLTKCSAMSDPFHTHFWSAGGKCWCTSCLIMEFPRAHIGQGRGDFSSYPMYCLCLETDGPEYQDEDDWFPVEGSTHARYNIKCPNPRLVWVKVDES